MRERSINVCLYLYINKNTKEIWQTRALKARKLSYTEKYIYYCAQLFCHCGWEEGRAWVRGCDHNLNDIQGWSRYPISQAECGVCCGNQISELTSFGCLHCRWRDEHELSELSMYAVVGIGHVVNKIWTMLHAGFNGLVGILQDNSKDTRPDTPTV